MAIGGGTLSMSTIAGEYGGSTPHSLSEYYRGGGLVPTHSNTAGIPTSGLIDFEDFQNTSATSPNDMFIRGNVGSWYLSAGKSANGYAGINVPNSATYTNNGGVMGSWIDNSMNINGNSRSATMMRWGLVIIGVNVPTVYFNASMSGLISTWSTSLPNSASGNVVINGLTVQLSGASGYAGIPTNLGFPTSHTQISNNGYDYAITFG